MKQPAHSMVQIPAGKTVQDLLLQYANVKNELGPIGTPCKVCACCEKPFSETCKPRAEFKIYQVNLSIPVAFLYRICGRCTRKYKKGGRGSDCVLAAIEKFIS